MKNVTNLLRTLRVMPIDELKTYEEVSQEHTKMLKRLFSSTRFFTNPIMVDEKSKLVLNGAHRLTALKELGYENVLCQIVDYSSKEVKLGTWFPAFKYKKPAEGFCLTHNGKYGYEFDECMKMLDKNEAAFALVNLQAGKKKCYAFLTEKPTWEEVCKTQSSIIGDMEKMNYVVYIPEEFVDGYLAEGYNILYRKSYTKKDVIESMKKRTLLPAKSTRHIVPDMMLGVNLPMEYLVVNIDKAQEELDKLIEERKARSAIRYYPEPVLVLDDY